MNPRKNKIIWYTVTTAIFAGLIYLADISKFLNALSNVKINPLLIATLFGFSMFIVWGTVWHMFFRHMEIETTYLKSLKLFMGGNFMNSVTPLGQFGGEPFMAYVISSNTDASYEKSISSVVSADIVNAFPIITFVIGGIIYLFLFSTLNNLIIKLAYLVVALVVVGGALAYLLWFEDELLEKMIFGALDRVKGFFGRGDKFVESLKGRIRDAKKSFRTVGEDPSLLIKTGVITHLAFVSQFLCLYFVLLSQSLEPSLTAIFFTIIVSGLAIWSPTPGGAGTYEAVFSGVLMLFYPIALDKALSTAILLRLSTFWLGLVIGYISLIDLRRG